MLGIEVLFLGKSFLNLIIIIAPEENKTNKKKSHTATTKVRSHLSIRNEIAGN